MTTITGKIYVDLLNNSLKSIEFHEHFTQSNHCGEDDWAVTLIDHYKGEDINGLREIELEWQHKLSTFKPNGLNDREALFEYG